VLHEQGEVAPVFTPCAAGSIKLKVDLPDGGQRTARFGFVAKR